MNYTMRQLVLVMILTLITYKGQAQKLWAGTTIDWFTAGNWNPSGVPSGTDNVIISSGAGAYPNITTGTATANNITINSGGSLTVGSAGVLQIAGSVSNSGTFDAGTGTITFNGSSVQTIPGASFASGTIKDLIISNTAGVSISSPLSIAPTGSVTVNSGSTLTTNGDLTLLSTSAGTARVANSAGTISGNVTVQRYIAGGRRAYRFLAHPFTTSQPLSMLTDDIDITGTGGATNGFTPSGTNNPSAKWYNVATANGSASNDPGWTSFTSTNGAGANAWAKGQGINVLVRGAKGEGMNGTAYTPSAVTLDMTGPINQGNQTITATKGSGSFYAFIGNPFPSQVNMSQIVRGVNVANNVYMWNANGGTKGAYIATTYGSAFILPSGASFIAVVAANSSNGITFNESAKSTSTPGTMLKTTSTDDNIRFSITSNNDSIWWDQLQVYFDNSTSSDSEWSFDASKFINPDVTFYSYSGDNKKLAIDTRPYKNGEVIHLGLEQAPVGTYTLKTDEFRMAEGTGASLYDKYLNKTVALSSGYVYHFDVTTDAATQGDRFELLLSGDAVTSVHTVAGSDIRVELAPNPAHDIVNLNYRLPAAGKAEVHVINIQGAVVRTIRSDMQTTGSMQIAVKDLPAGMYIVELNCAGQKAIQKFIKD